MEALDTLNALGITLPTPAYIAASLLFSLLGLYAYYYGKRAELPMTRWLGVALMVYPYFISDTRILVLAGTLLCAGAWWSAN